MTIPNLKPRNGVGGWILIAMLCGGASGGATWLRPQPPPPHNPDITTAAWVKMTVDMERIDRNLATLTADVREIAQRLPQQPPPQRP